MCTALLTVIDQPVLISPGLMHLFFQLENIYKQVGVTNFWFLLVLSIGSGTESDSDDSVPELEEQDSAQTQTQQAQVRVHTYLKYCIYWDGHRKDHYICC